MVKVIGQRTNTTKVRYSTAGEMHVPGWDKNSGSAQASRRVDERAADGQRKVPIGRGVAIKQK
jgi:hypothetical protein